MSSLQWSSTRQGTCWPQGIKVAEWSSFKERLRSGHLVVITTLCTQHCLHNVVVQMLKKRLLTCVFFSFSSSRASQKRQVPVLKPTDLMVEVRPRRVFANGHTYHINSISVNSDGETYLSADDLRINMWHLDITDRNIKPANMEDLTEVITAAEFHPHHCHLFVYSSSKGTLRLCDMRASALCDKHTKHVKFSHSGRYLLTRDYLTAKVWDLNMDKGPVETYQ
ncbi:Serine/threonine-protein phosphatase 2A 55 kDa regulatory subunit B gamma isoform, partial [Goodea atripinnis]